VPSVTSPSIDQVTPGSHVLCGAFYAPLINGDVTRFPLFSGVCASSGHQQKFAQTRREMHEKLLPLLGDERGASEFPGKLSSSRGWLYLL
jgi:hypothetical protein